MVPEDGPGQCLVRKELAGVMRHIGMTIVRIQRKESCEQFASCGGHGTMEEQSGWKDYQTLGLSPFLTGCSFPTLGLFLPHFLPNHPKWRSPHLSPWASSIFSVHTKFSWSIPTLVVLSTMLILMTSVLTLTSRLTPPIASRAPRLRSPTGVPVLWVQRLPGVLCWNCSSKLLQSNWFPSRCSGQKILGVPMDASLSHPHTITKKSCWLDLQNRTRIWPLLTPSAAAPWTEPCHPTWIFSSSTPAFQVLLALTLPSCTQNSQHQSCSDSVQMHVRAWLSSAHTAERAFILLTGKLQSFQGPLTHLFTQLQPRWPLCCSHHLLSLGGSSSWEPPSSLPFSCCCLHVPSYWGLLRPPCQELHAPSPAPPKPLL